MSAAHPPRPLQARSVERVWGRTSLPDGFQTFGTGTAIGEIWHEDRDSEAELLVKHLFTSERLSIQVHPDDEAARSRGHPRGKDEAWFVVEAEPGAVIGIGLKERVEPGELREAALNGSIEGLVDWRPVAAGDFFYSPAGTIHAIGAGVSLIEVQQNLDLTYRLYDYGRPRELHLDQGLAVSDRAPWTFWFEPRPMGAGRTILVAGAAFVIESWSVDRERIIDGSAGLLVIARSGNGQIGGAPIASGSVWTVEGRTSIEPDGQLELLIAYPGPDVRDIAGPPTGTETSTTG